MFAGPIFSREALTLPRQPRHFFVRAGYVVLLLVLVFTAAMSVLGLQRHQTFAASAAFGELIFQVISLVQLTLVLFFGLLLAAGTVAQEKDRRTLILLLMTDMSDRELVLGKLFSSLLSVGVLIIAAVPVFCFLRLLGGVTLTQIGCVTLLCLAAAFLAGSWGTLVAFWREKTFQTLAIGVLGLIVYIGLIEGLAFATAGTSAASVIGYFSPYRSLLNVLNPFAPGNNPASIGYAALGGAGALIGVGVLINGIAIWRLRVWNPPRMIHQEQKKETIRRKHRSVWEKPVIWREIRTRAYGKKIFVIKLAYLVFSAALIFSAVSNPSGDAALLGMVSQGGAILVALSLLSLLLVNAQAVTAITSERDGQTLELLLVTDVSPKEFVLGKLGGVIFNAKELLAVPIGFAIYLAASGQLSVEGVICCIFGFLVLMAFAAVLGLHSGLNYESSRQAIANSLGTIFFLFIGIFILLLLLIEARGKYMLQLPSFIIFIGMGSYALVASLARKNPSMALFAAGGLLPFLTFYAITEYLLESTFGVVLIPGAAYLFAVLAMLMPALHEFDSALGRTKIDNG